VTWEQAGKFIGLAGVVSVLPLYWALDFIPWLILMFLIAISSLAFLLYSRNLRCRDLTLHIENQGNAANLLIEQINIRHNQASLIRELGQASATLPDTDKLLDFFMTSIEKRLDFQRGLLLLTNPDKTMIHYASGFGYDAQDESYLKNASFHLDNPQSRAPFVVAFQEMKAIIVSDIKEMEGKISGRSREFIDRLGVTSFICAPIAFEGEPLGILALDSLRPERPFTESDISLITGIAHQIALSLHLAAQQREIRENEKKFRTLTENAPDIIYSLDNQGNLTYLNRIWKKVMGLSRREAIGGRLDQFCDESEKEKLHEMLLAIKLRRLAVTDRGLALRRRDGAERLFQVSGTPWLDDEDQFLGVIGIMKDITEQKRLETQLQQAAKMEALGRLTGGISHDFNNLLQAIGGYNQILLTKKKPDDPDRKYLNNIDQLIQKARDLIKQLLFFARKADTAFKNLNLNGEISEVKDLLESIIPKMMTIKLDLASDLNLIRADKVQIHQTIMNLALNARDAMTEGGELTITTRNVSIPARKWRQKFWIEPADYVKLVFADNGSGISPENLENIFEPFFTTKELGQGTGMGLSVVYGIAKNHGGYIWCDSVWGRGTAFHLLFPATNVHSEEESRQNIAAQPPPTGREGILLVDDEQSIRETTAEILALNGYQVLTASSGEEALSVFQGKRDKIDLVVLDLIMPGMGGEKCLRELRALDPGIKVIISSGFAAQMSPETQQETGPVCFIAKPYDYDFFLEELRTVLNGPAI
jgi:PAS domain S-box-containing protein